MSLAGNDGVIWVRGSGDKIYQQTIGNLYSAITITSANGTTPQVMFTGAPGYIITELGMQVDPISTIAANGMVNLFFSDSSFGTFFNIRWFIPQSVSPTNIAVATNTRVTNGPGFFWNNKTANSSVSVATDVALIAGSIRFFARYALTSIVG
jgi:hypothetical protein